MNGTIAPELTRTTFGALIRIMTISHDSSMDGFYGKNLVFRAELTAQWLDERHPYRERFLRQRELIEEVLVSRESPGELQRSLLNRGTSLRCMAREIPPVFGSFFPQTKSKT